jgi:hypothetical protein
MSLRFLKDTLYLKCFPNAAKISGCQSKFVFSTQSRFYNYGTLIVPIALIGNVRVCCETNSMVPESCNEYLYCLFSKSQLADVNNTKRGSHSEVFSYLSPVLIESIGTHLVNKMAHYE